MEQNFNPKIVINNVSYKLRHKNTAIIDYNDFPFSFDYLGKDMITFKQFDALWDKCRTKAEVVISVAK